MSVPTHVNNLFNIKIDNISINGNVNFGYAIQKGHSANVKSSGGQSVIGDLSPSFMIDCNIVKDADVVDQPQIQI